MKNLLTCRKNPGPLYEDLPQIVGVPDEAPPAGHDELLVAGGGEGLQVGQRGVRRVLGKLAPLGLARPATRDYCAVTAPHLGHSEWKMCKGQVCICISHFIY
jgi:hypothetical protein